MFLEFSCRYNLTTGEAGDLEHHEYVDHGVYCIDKPWSISPYVLADTYDTILMVCYIDTQDIPIEEIKTIVQAKFNLGALDYLKNIKYMYELAENRLRGNIFGE